MCLACPVCRTDEKPPTFSLVAAAADDPYQGFAPQWLRWFCAVPPGVPCHGYEWDDLFHFATALPREAWGHLEYHKAYLHCVRGEPITNVQSLLPYRGRVPPEYPPGTTTTYDDLPGVAGRPGGGAFALRLDILRASGSRNLVVHEGTHTYVAYRYPGFDDSEPFLSVWNAEKPSLWDQYVKTYPWEFFAEGMARHLHHARYGNPELSGLSQSAWAYFKAVAASWGWNTPFPL